MQIAVYIQRHFFGNYFFLDEISRQVLDSSAKAIITIPALYSTVEKALKLAQKQVPIITINTQVCKTFKKIFVG